MQIWSSTSSHAVVFNIITVVIVVMSRLVYRRGTDLLTTVIPYICHKYPHVHLLIGKYKLYTVYMS